MPHFLELDHIWEHLSHTFLECLKLLPFLFLTYLVMEFIEHHAGSRLERTMTRTGRLGPVVGAALGVVPQCGFSSAAAGLYAGRLITRGTLLAVFLSTSDEMLPILISNKAPFGLILKLLASKLLLALVAGLAVDAVMELLRRRRQSREYPDEIRIRKLCEGEGCHCDEKGVLRSAVEHTLHIFLFLFLVSFVLDFVVHTFGEERLASLILHRPILGEALAGLVGLIPNCASSVVLTELFLSGVLPAGTLLAGLLVNAGVGILVLFRTNRNRYESIRIVALLYVIGVLGGILLNLLPAGTWL
jgi:hypothetical protein